jgi:hypothetical protein
MNCNTGIKPVFFYNSRHFFLGNPVARFNLKYAIMNQSLTKCVVKNPFLTAWCPIFPLNIPKRCISLPATWIIILTIITGDSDENKMCLAGQR